MVLKIDVRVNNSFFPDLPKIDLGDPVNAVMRAGSVLATMMEVAPLKAPTPGQLPGGLGGGLRLQPPLSPYAGVAATVLLIGATAYHFYQSRTQASKTAKIVPVGEPNLDDLKRLLEDAERQYQELEKQSPAWYSNPYSPEVTRHHAKRTELSFWIERLKLEIDLKEWEEMRRDRLAENIPVHLEDRHIADLKQRIATHSIRAEKSLGALGGIVASASTGGTQSAAPVATRKSEPVDGDGEPDSDAEPICFLEGAIVMVQDYSVNTANVHTVALHITDGVIDQASITGIQSIRELIPNDKTDVKVHVTDAMPDQVSDWQYTWLDNTFNTVEDHKPALREINERLKRGAAPTADQNNFLQDLQNKTDAMVDRYSAENAALGWVTQHLAKTSDDEAMQMAIRAAIHNSQPSWAALLNHSMLIEKMKNGRAVLDKDLETKPKLAATSLNTVLHEGLAQAAAELNQYGVKAIIDKDLPLVRVSLSPKQTRKLVGMLANMMGNGGRYCDPDKPEADRWLKVGAHILSDHGVEITTEDNGQGMAADFVHHRLGKPLAQEGRKQVARSSGTGVWSVFNDAVELGLPPVQVKSAVGEGSAFRIVLPQDKVTWQDGKFPSTVDRNSIDIEEGFVVPDAAKPTARILK